MERTAGPNESPRYEETPCGEVPRYGYRSLLHGMKDTPAVVLSHRRDVLLWNRLGCALLAWHLTGLAEPAPCPSAGGPPSGAGAPARLRPDAIPRPEGQVSVSAVGARNRL
ncbi:hypothetical protein [Streptomyces sp. NBC_01190]|uniref:MmyB family transcriptional regulator n=1 Tax=Streptomyces sp. NBC_01190 TaxID=2903767 RepID=UPI0038678240